MGWLQQWRRRKLDRERFPEEWDRILESKVPLFRGLDAARKQKLRQLIRYFIAEKSFEGCGGLELCSEHKVVIAALCCVPLLGDVSDLYPGLRAVLVYPGRYHARYSEYGVDGVVTEGVESRSGESWDQGVLVFSWDEIRSDLFDSCNGSNIVYHECAHQLDYEWGVTMDPLSFTATNRKSMASVLKEEYRRLQKALASNRRIAVDEYAGENIHEFFAVMSETWFERPGVIRTHYPQVDRIFRQFYNMSPDLIQSGQ